MWNKAQSVTAVLSMSPIISHRGNTASPAAAMSLQDSLLLLRPERLKSFSYLSVAKGIGEGRHQQDVGELRNSSECHGVSMATWSPDQGIYHLIKRTLALNRAPVSVPLLTLRHPYYPRLIRRWARGQHRFDSWESKQLQAETLVPEDERLVNVHRDS
ncbi:unnamed protein product [Boreogadus saida]